MILEAVLLSVKTGHTDLFERDIQIASQYISATQGYIKHSFQRCIENPQQYILLVEWDTLESHTVNFRQSNNYLEWKRLLHHYYDPIPTVLHYAPI